MTDNLTHLRMKRLEARVHALEEAVGLEDPDAANGEGEGEEEGEEEEQDEAPRAAKKTAKKATKKAAGRR